VTLSTDDETGPPSLCRAAGEKNSTAQTRPADRVQEACIEEQRAATGVQGKGMKRRTKEPEAKREIMTLQQVADYLNCHYFTVFRLLHAGKLPGFRLGGGWRFIRDDLNKWIARKEMECGSSMNAGRI
jgi:excisionase family DNA binding protein